MNDQRGWLERSLQRARQNIEQRPEHLKPQRYRSEEKAAEQPKRKKAK